MIEAGHVEVSVTLRDTLRKTTITKDAFVYSDSDETQAALLHDLIALARLDLRVDEEEVWTFGTPSEIEASDE